jgi:AcrR family transcriptional regulator
MVPSTRDRLVTAAFELFDEQGYDGTTVDEIATRAGAGRTTFFRHFRGKEEVVFPDHDDLLRLVGARLATATPATLDVGLREAARIVLDHYLDEGETARARYRLTSTVPALRSREVASVQRYQRLFTQHLQQSYHDAPDGPLRAELLGAAIVTAHNHVLRSWLRGLAHDVAAEFDAAMTQVLAPRNAQLSQTTVVVTTASDVEQVLSEVRSALTDGQRPTA